MTNQPHKTQFLYIFINKPQPPESNFVYQHGGPKSLPKICQFSLNNGYRQRMLIRTGSERRTRTRPCLCGCGCNNMCAEGSGRGRDICITGWDEREGKPPWGKILATPPGIQKPAHQHRNPTSRNPKLCTNSSGQNPCHRRRNSSPCNLPPDRDQTLGF